MLEICYELAFATGEIATYSILQPDFLAAVGGGGGGGGDSSRKIAAAGLCSIKSCPKKYFVTAKFTLSLQNSLSVCSAAIKTNVCICIH